MPLYRYGCNACDQEQTVAHSAEEKHTECIYCGSTDIKKIYKTLSSSKSSDPTRPGDLVKDYINSSKEDLKEQKSGFKERKYEKWK